MYFLQALQVKFVDIVTVIDVTKQHKTFSKNIYKLHNHNRLKILTKVIPY